MEVYKELCENVVCWMFLNNQWWETSLWTAGAMTFYPLQIMVLKVFIERRRELIASGKTILECLQVLFEDDDS